MTNGEKYLKDGVSVEEFSQKLWNYIKSREMNEPTLLINDFLNMKIKPTLTEDEIVILKNIDTEMFEKIGKTNSNGDLYLTYKGDRDTEDFWWCNSLFQFIKERRRI